jgi:transcription elongation factor Elf1
MSGSYCPVCQNDSGVDAEDWFRQHEHNALAVCANCGAKLKAYYDEYENEGGFWAFEPTDPP